MFIEVTHFSTKKELGQGSISLFGKTGSDATPCSWTEDWFIIGDFYFVCKKEHKEDENVYLVQHDEEAQSWIGNMQDVRMVRYVYEGPQLPWYRHERNMKIPL
jgi:hypothetical protein